MIETDLHLEPNEASDLCHVFDAAALARHGWDRAFLTVLDEANAEDSLVAAEFRADGRLLLGLRYPVTASGHPLLVEVADVEALFADPDAVPACGGVWWLEDAGDAGAPVGFRALDSRGEDSFDAVVGDLDAANKSSTVLEDHPQGWRAASEHRRFTLTEGGGPVGSELIHHFGDVRRVEGVTVDLEGHAHYVIDAEGHVALRTLVID